jgi:hypothetical protein
MFDREIGEPGEMTGKRRIELDEEGIHPRLGHRPKGGLELREPSRAEDL